MRPHLVDAPARIGGQVGVRDDVVGPGQGEVAEQDGRGQPELLGRTAPALPAVPLGEQPVHGGQATAGRRTVDDVVVHQGAGLQQFQCGEQAQYRRVGRVPRIGGDGAPAPVGEGRADALAAAQDELFECSGHLGVGVTDVGAVPPALGEIVEQLICDGVRQLASRRTCGIDAQRASPLLTPKWCIQIRGCRVSSRTQ
ncbi:Uncharacterised protein [Mycobacteroides abscessus subsp. abscessus]|nr:Uncharacterised protein [Mycobacteroides abscessus subsp. abscessus]